MLDEVYHLPHMPHLPRSQPFPSLASLSAPYPATTLLLQLLQGCYVALRQIHHMDVIPHTCRGSGYMGRLSLCSAPLVLTPRLTCPILRGIVITKDIQGFPSPDCHLGQRSGQLLPEPWHQWYSEAPWDYPPYLGDIGHEVVGNALGVLADAAGGMGACGIEVPKQHCIPGLCGAGQTVGPGHTQ